MSATTSIGTMIKRISGLADTKDVSGWESQFINDVVAKTGDGAHTKALSEKQVATIERIHTKHFEGD